MSQAVGKVSRNVILGPCFNPHTMLPLLCIYTCPQKTCRNGIINELSAGGRTAGMMHICSNVALQ